MSRFEGNNKGDESNGELYGAVLKLLKFQGNGAVAEDNNIKQKRN